MYERRLIDTHRPTGPGGYDPPKNLDRRTSTGGCEDPAAPPRPCTLGSDPSDSLDGVDAPDDDTLMGSSLAKEPKDRPAPPRPALTAQTSPDCGAREWTTARWFRRRRAGWCAVIWSRRRRIVGAPPTYRATRPARPPRPHKSPCWRKNRATPSASASLGARGRRDRGGARRRRRRRQVRSPRRSGSPKGKAEGRSPWRGPPTCRSLSFYRRLDRPIFFVARKIAGSARATPCSASRSRGLRTGGIEGRRWTFALVSRREASRDLSLRGSEVRRGSVRLRKYRAESASPRGKNAALSRAELSGSTSSARELPPVTVRVASPRTKG